MQDSDPMEWYSMVRTRDLQRGGTSEFEVWLLEAADKPVSLLSKADFIAIRERVWNKFAA